MRGINKSNGSMRSIATIFAMLSLFGCGTAFVASSPTVPNATEWKTILQNIYSNFTNLKMKGFPEISSLHKNDALGTPADSAICLRNSGTDPTKYIVFLIRQNKIVDFRLALELDRCNEQSYTPLVKP